MNVKDYLERMPEQVKRQIAANEPLRSGLKQGKQLAELLTSPEFVQSMLRSMSSVERATLELIVRRIGFAPFDGTRLDKAASGRMTGAQLDIGLMRLCQKGIVIAMRKMWGERVYVLPLDLFRLLQSLLIDVSPLRGEDDSDEIAISRAGSRGLAFDLFFFLSYVAKHEVTLTQKGLVPKSHMQKMCNLLELRDEALAGLVRYAHAEAYPPAFAVVYDAALKLGLVRREDDRLQLNVPVLRRWLAQTAERMNRSLYGLWERTQMPSEAAMQHFVLLLGRLPRDRWFPVQRMIRFLASSDIIHEDDVRLRDGVLRWLNAMASLGWIEIGELAGEPVFRRVTDIREAAMPHDGTAQPIRSAAYEKFIVQPDFEIIVPPTVPFSIRWELEWIAEHRRTDQVSIYSLTKDSVARACEAGRDGESCLDFLRRNSLYELPENVVLQVTQWASRANRVYLSQVTLLRCRDVAVAREIRESEACRPYLLAELGERDFIVDAERLDELTRALTRCDLPPGKRIPLAAPGCLAGSGDMQRSECSPVAADGTGCKGPLGHDADDPDIFEAGQEGIVFSPLAVPDYELQANIPTVEDIFPRWKEIPAMWFKQCRRYHASTQRQIVEQAIEWRTLVKLRKEGHELSVLPLRIQDDNSRAFRLIGRTDAEEVSLAHDSWEEIQLVLPGINED